MARAPIVTSRLMLRPATLADVPALFEFLGDAAAMQHTRHFANFRACRRHVAVHEWQRRQDGYAPWVVCEKSSSVAVGYGGLFDDPVDPGWGIELGYWFHPSVWGRGYATELVTASLDFADRVLQLPAVQAFVRPENFASLHVLEKVGFAVSRFVPELQRLLYVRCGDAG